MILVLHTVYYKKHNNVLFLSPVNSSMKLNTYKNIPDWKLLAGISPYFFVSPHGDSIASHQRTSSYWCGLNVWFRLQIKTLGISFYNDC